MRTAEHRDLEERRKEFACLTGICGLFALREHSLEQTLSRAASLVASGWQYPDRAVVRTRLGTLDVSTAAMPAAVWRLRRPIASGGRALGVIEVAYPREVAARASMAFLPTERALLEAVAALMGTMAERVQANVASLVGPAIARLARPGLSPEARSRLLLEAEKHLDEVTSGLGYAVKTAAPGLSPREVEVCDLVRTGLSNKEIASTLGVSPLTVERHRHNIRRKLGLAGASTNLATYLSDLR